MTTPTPKPLLSVIVTDVKFDTDGEDVSLPATFEFSYDELLDGEALEQRVSDDLSAATGFCHTGFAMVLGDCDVRASIRDYVEDHYQHFGAYPGEVTYTLDADNEVTYDFDTYMALAGI